MDKINSDEIESVTFDSVVTIQVANDMSVMSIAMASGVYLP